MTALSLTLLDQLLVQLFQALVDLGELEVLFLELLAAVEQLLVHQRQATELVLHLNSCLAKPGLSILFPIVELLSHVLESTMHLLDSCLVLLQDLNCIVVFCPRTFLQHSSLLVKLRLQFLVLLSQGS